MQSDATKNRALPSAYSVGISEQNEAAGGKELRKLRTKTGDIVTVSLAVSQSGGNARVVMRYKWGGSTVTRSVGTTNAATRLEVLQWGWKKVREAKVVEREGWSWVVESSGA